MSVVSIGLHGGELQKLVEYCYETFVADTARFLYKKGVKSRTTDGLRESADRRYLRASQTLASFSSSLSPTQRALIDEHFRTMVDFQARLQRANLSRSEKRNFAQRYDKAAQEYERAIQVTSLKVSYDLANHMAQSEAYHMAAACGQNDIDALEMAQGMMSAYQGSLPETTPKPRKAKMSNKTASKVPAIMMNHVTRRVNDAKSN